MTKAKKITIFSIFAILAIAFFSLFSISNKKLTTYAASDSSRPNFVLVSDTFNDTLPSGFVVSYLWTDGTNIYYSNSTSQYVLDFETHTWSEFTWDGLTDFFGDYIWCCRYPNGYVQYHYSQGSTQYKLAIYSDTGHYQWYVNDMSSRPGLTSYMGNYVWTDGVNYYYSANKKQCIYDYNTDTWSEFVWNGLTSFSGSNVWSDGINYYYSQNSKQYVLDIDTHTWSEFAWNGLTSFSGINVWSDGVNYYYSSSTKQYVLDIDTHTWSVSRFSGLCFSGVEVWTDGVDFYVNSSKLVDFSSFSEEYYNDIYQAGYDDGYKDGYDIGFKDGYSAGHDTGYSEGFDDGFKDHSNLGFYPYSHRGLSYIDGNNVWFDGTYYHYDDIAYTNHISHFIYDKDNSIWVEKSYPNIDYGQYIWTDGVDIYYSCYYMSGNVIGANYIYNKNTDTFSNVSFNGFNDINGNAVWSDGHNTYYKLSHVFDRDTKSWLSANFVNVPDNFNSYRSPNVPVTINGVSYAINGQTLYSLTYPSNTWNVIEYTGITNEKHLSLMQYGGLWSDGKDLYYSCKWGVNEAFNYKFNFDTNSFELVVFPLYNDIVHCGFYTMYDVLHYDYNADSSNPTHWTFNSVDYDTYSLGYSVGYKAGVSFAKSQVDKTSASYNAGYNYGLDNAKEFTFFGLIGAVFDAPIKALTGLLNFNLLGVNLFGLFTGLLTLAIIIFIIKLVLGGK